MPPTDRIDLVLDHRLVAAALWTACAVAPVAAVLGGIAAGRGGAVGALLGAGVVGCNGAASAWVSARTGRSRRQIGPGRVLAALPVRMLVLAVTLAVAVGPLGLPAAPVGLAVMVTEICVVAAQGWLVLRGPTFVGPLE